MKSGKEYMLKAMALVLVLIQSTKQAGDLFKHLARDLTLVLVEEALSIFVKMKVLDPAPTNYQLLSISKDVILVLYLGPLLEQWQEASTTYQKTLLLLTNIMCNTILRPPMDILLH
jgi:hypothetical protein